MGTTRKNLVQQYCSRSRRQRALYSTTSCLSGMETYLMESAVDRVQVFVELILKKQMDGSEVSGGRSESIAYLRQVLRLIFEYLISEPARTIPTGFLWR